MISDGKQAAAGVRFQPGQAGRLDDLSRPSGRVLSETSTIPAETIGLESPVIFDDQFSQLAVSQGVLFRRLEKAKK